MAHDCIIARDLSWIRCLKCNRTSHNRNDVLNAYCGHCHEYRSSGIVEQPAEAACDFCTDGTPVWEYPAKSFDTGEKYGRIVPESTGNWLACEKCADLVEKGDREGLLNRALDSFARVHAAAAALAPQTKYLHDSFFEERSGQRQKIRPVIN